MSATTEAVRTPAINDDDIYVIDLTTRTVVEQHGSRSVAAHAMRAGAVWGVRPGQALVRGLQAKALLGRAVWVAEDLAEQRGAA